MSPLDSVPVWSTTRPVSCGTATSAKAEQARQTSSATTQALTTDSARKAGCSGLFRGRRGWCRQGRGCRVRRVEIDLRRGRDLALILHGEIRHFLVAKRHRGQVGREGADAGGGGRD